LNGIELQGLKGQNLPQILVGQITSRQYHYNPLSELIAIQMPDETLGFGYDGAGRLRQQAHYDTREYMQALEGQATPHTTRRWKIDPAGNRLPGKVITEQQQKQSWVEQVRQRWQDPEFNLLGEGSASQQQQGPINHWPDNRIAFDENSAWRYSDQGNRVEQTSQNPQHYERQRLYFDGANQLAALQVDSTDGSGPAVMQNAARYVYDALGRRLKKTVKDQNSQIHITYFGWDGDRLVHTETVKEDGTREIVHIIYEPSTFTPMVRLSTTVDAKAWQPKPHFIVQAALAGLTQRQKNNEAVWDDLQAMQNALERMSGHDSGQMEKTLRRALLEDPPTNRVVGLGPHLDNMMTIEDMRRGLQEQEAQEIKTPIVVHYFHTDHLGTPLALTDQSGKMVWATRLDPWGNVEDEYNPQGIEQNIRLPGQYHDKESGLYYNRHRYYDSKIGSYINQDPVGLFGGVNKSIYAVNPLRFIDPFGLANGDYPAPPPGYNPSTWQQGQWPNGKYYLIDPNGDKYTIHAEDPGHWRHWDKQNPKGQRLGSCPPKSGKPRSTRPNALKSNQSTVDPSGNAPQWRPVSPPAETVPMTVNPAENPVLEGGEGGGFTPPRGVVNPPISPIESEEGGGGGSDVYNEIHE
jgi:RHS repeat-associated protein